MLHLEFNAEVTRAGNLRISLVDGLDSDELMAYAKEKTDIHILCEGLESYSSNGGYQPFDGGDGNPFVGLTCAPCIAESMDYDDNGNATVVGDCWYYPGYMVTNPIEEIAENGFVLFRKI